MRGYQPVLFRWLAGCCYPIIKPAPIVDGFRVAHKTSTPNELEERWARRSAYWGSAAFLDILRVSAIQSFSRHISKLSSACEGDPSDNQH